MNTYIPLRPRVIPCLLLQNNGLVKTIQFKDPTYLGDPRNVVKIFNDKEVDELVLLDITATKEGRGPNFDLISEIASECFAPFGYGGGVSTVDEVRQLINIGLEKVVINTEGSLNPSLLEDAAKIVGSQSVVGSIDVRKKGLSGKYEVYIRGGTEKTGKDPVTVAKQMEQSGAGEIVITSIERDGTYEGYDLKLVRSVTENVTVPVIACGGASDINDLVGVIEQGGASAAAAGSIFVFHGPLRGVLINFPSGDKLNRAFSINSLDLDNSL